MSATTPASTRLLGLHLDYFFAPPTADGVSTPVLLDRDGDAQITLADGATLKELYLSTEANAKLGIRLAAGEVEIDTPQLEPGSMIIIDGVVIGRVTGHSNTLLTFRFVEATTPADIEKVRLAAEKLIRAITFTNLDTTSPSAEQRVLIVVQDDKAGSDDARAYMADRILGDGGDNVIEIESSHIGLGDEIDGRAGNDVLKLKAGGLADFTFASRFEGIETVQGSSVDDTIYLSAAQIAKLDKIDAGGQAGDRLYITGDAIDLRGIDIEGVAIVDYSGLGTTLIVDDLSDARLLDGRLADGETLTIAGGTLTDADRLMLHEKKIDFVSHNGRTTTLADVDGSGSASLGFAYLNGDAIQAAPGATVFLDAGRNAELMSPQGHLGFLAVRVIDGMEGHQLGVDTAGRVKLSNGLNTESEVSVDGIVIGQVTNVPTGTALSFALNDRAAPVLVQEFVRALTYHNTKNTLVAPIQIQLIVKDAAGQPAVAQVTVSAAHAPTDIALSASSIAENSIGGADIAVLSAADPDAGDAFTYALLDDAGGRFAVANGKLIVRAGARLDYEQAQSHTVRVRATDKYGLSREEDFTIAVTDIREAVPGATKGKNALVGGIGADKLNGGSGNDRLTGGAGADAFVFDTALGRGTNSKNQNKKVNFDTITDFKPGEDKIWLDNKIFTKLGKAGSAASPAALNKKVFKKTKATDKDDYLVYKNGVISYDQDGKGTKYKPVEIIKIANKAALSAADFLVI